MFPKTGKTGDMNLLSAMTKYSAASERRAFSWDQGSTLFEEKTQSSVSVFITGESVALSNFGSS